MNAKIEEFDLKRYCLVFAAGWSGLDLNGFQSFKNVIILSIVRQPNSIFNITYTPFLIVMYDEITCLIFFLTWLMKIKLSYKILLVVTNNDEFHCGDGDKTTLYISEWFELVLELAAPIEVPSMTHFCLCLHVLFCTL